MNVDYVELSTMVAAQSEHVSMNGKIMITRIILIYPVFVLPLDAGYFPPIRGLKARCEATVNHSYCAGHVWRSYTRCGPGAWELCAEHPEMI